MGNRLFVNFEINMETLAKHFSTGRVCHMSPESYRIFKGVIGKSLIS